MSNAHTVRMPASTASSRASRRGFCWLRILLGSTLGLVAFFLLLAGVSVLWLRTAAHLALPALDGDLQITGLSAPVTVRRDAHGVPHIEAATQDDLFVAQGYVTAQDRLWQMDVYRRNANGELAEILGPSLMKHDRAQRVFSVSQYRSAYLCQPGSRRPRAARRLCPRRESLHRPAPVHAARGVQTAVLSPPALERRRLSQHRHDAGADARFALGRQAGARTDRRRPAQSQAGGGSLPR